jgi:putative cell wall-binding protein
MAMIGARRLRCNVRGTPTSRRLLAVLLLGAVAVAGCGRKSPATDAQRPALVAPQRAEPVNLGFPELATKNTTRIPGSESTQIAAAVARVVYPGPQSGPAAVTLVDTSDWRVAVAAAALTAAPFDAPLLFSDGSDMPGPSSTALKALSPAGSDAAGKAQIIRIGAVAKPAGYKSSDVTGTSPLGLTRAIATLVRSAGPRRNQRVLVASADDSSFAAPAAAYAAKSGDPVLFVTRDRIPPETRAALGRLKRPKIYVLGPSSVISPKVTRELRRLGGVTRYGSKDPVGNSIAAARFKDGPFGWGVVDPGHGLVFVRAGRPLDAVAASALSSAGKYGPLLLLDDAAALPQAIQQYLLDIQPGYSTDPVTGVYNHAWIIGTSVAISAAQQARIDALLEIVPVRTPDAPPTP